jgi:hypothetical protein
MNKNAPIKPAKNFNMNTIKRGQDNKTEYIVDKKSNGIKYWKKLKLEEKKCLKEFEKKKIINLSEYKKGIFVNNKQALAVTYSQLFKKNPNCKKYIGNKSQKQKNKSQKQKNKSQKQKKKSQKQKSKK